MLRTRTVTNDDIKLLNLLVHMLIWKRWAMLAFLLAGAGALFVALAGYLPVAAVTVPVGLAVAALGAMHMVLCFCMGRLPAGIQPHAARGSLGVGLVEFLAGILVGISFMAPPQGLLLLGGLFLFSMLGEAVDNSAMMRDIALMLGDEALRKEVRAALKSAPSRLTWSLLLGFIFVPVVFLPLMLISTAGGPVVMVVTLAVVVAGCLYLSWQSGAGLFQLFLRRRRAVRRVLEMLSRATAEDAERMRERIRRQARETTQGEEDAGSEPRN